MIEAMACGTPVIATPYGAVPEVVTDGVNGFIASSVDDMVEAVKKIDGISPEVCRAVVEQRFAPSVMTDGYEAVYRRVARHE